MDGELINIYEWNVFVTAKITATGIWLPKFASRCAMSEGVWGEFENDEYGFDAEDLSKAERFHNMARQLATAMIVRKLWEKDEHAKMKVALSV